jgi:hypothetical protein
MHRSPLPPGNMLGTVRGWVNLRATVRAEGLSHREPNPRPSNCTNACPLRYVRLLKPTSKFLSKCFFLVAQQSNFGPDRLTVEVSTTHTHTYVCTHAHTHTHMLELIWTGDQIIAPTQHNKHKRRITMLQWDSNTRSQQMTAAHLPFRSRGLLDRLQQLHDEKPNTLYRAC